MEQMLLSVQKNILVSFRFSDMKDSIAIAFTLSHWALYSGLRSPKVEFCVTLWVCNMKKTKAHYTIGCLHRKNR